MLQIIHRTREVKLYIDKAQEDSLDAWLSSCCAWYNQCLHHRLAAHEATGKAIKLAEHSELLAATRTTNDKLKDCPSQFSRDAARRAERRMRAFLRREAGLGKAGRPRLKPVSRYRSMEALATYSYFRGNKIHIPGLGEIRCRGGHQDFAGKQLLLRVIRRASGWYAQVVLEQEIEVKEKTGDVVGIDLGLESFATLSTGQKIENPRFRQKGLKKLKHLQRLVYRKKRGSANRKKAAKKVARQHEKIKTRRRAFAHKEAKKIVEKFGVIAYENLAIASLAASKLRQSVLDAGWGQFIRFVVYKAVEAGKRTIAVDPSGTSQTCPDCGEIRDKPLSERIHHCGGCGLKIHRDHAAALVIKERAQGIARASKPVESAPTQR